MQVHFHAVGHHYIRLVGGNLIENHLIVGKNLDRRLGEMLMGKFVVGATGIDDNAHRGLIDRLQRHQPVLVLATDDRPFAILDIRK